MLFGVLGFIGAFRFVLRQNLPLFMELMLLITIDEAFVDTATPDADGSKNGRALVRIPRVKLGGIGMQSALCRGF